MSRLLGNLSRWLGRLPTGWWVAIAIVPALVPLVHGGFFESADGRLHLDRLAALDQAVRAGVLLPRWFPDLAFGYGHPVLNFYGPLSYYLALPFTLLGASPIVALKLVFAAALVGSGLGMLLLARRHLDRGAAAVAAIVYVYLPYHLLDVYVRGAVAETLTFAWLPLILWSLNRLVAGRAEDRQHFTWLSGLLTAALVITHSLSAVLVAPVLAAYVVLLLVERRDARALGRMTLAMVVGLGASAFHWLPIVAEARYVGLGYGTSQGYQNHLLPLSGLVSFSPAYDYTSQAGAPVTYPLGLMQAALMIAGLAAACWPGARRWLPRPGVVRLFGVVGLVSAFMVTTASLPVWRALEPVLAFLQYPWRFELLTVLGTAVLAGALAQAVIAGCKRWGRRIEHAAAWTMVGVLLVATVGASLWRLPFVPVQPDLAVEEMWRLDRESGQVGTTWTGEYLPIGVTEQRWAISRSATELAPSSSPDAVATMAAGELWLTGVAATRYRFSLGAPLGTEVVLHQFYYPGWQARWQGQTVPGRAAGSLGLAAFDLGPGVGQLDVRLAHTPAQLWGTLISAFILLAGGVLLIARFSAGTAAIHGQDAAVRHGLPGVGGGAPGRPGDGQRLRPRGDAGERQPGKQCRTAGLPPRSRQLSSRRHSAGNALLARAAAAGAGLQGVCAPDRRGDDAPAGAARRRPGCRLYADDALAARRSGSRCPQSAAAGRPAAGPLPAVGRHVPV